MKKTGNLKSILAITILLCSLSTQGQTVFKEKLLKDVVTIENENFTVEEYMLINIGDEESFQLKTSATAPTSIISRDNFVSIYSGYGIIMLVVLMDELEISINDYDIKKLDELIGQPDITIHFEMAKNGMQIQLIADEGTKSLTMTWSDIFEE